MLNQTLDVRDKPLVEASVLVLWRKCFSNIQFSNSLCFLLFFPLGKSFNHLLVTHCPDKWL
jgi:hypothetical protein